MERRHSRASSVDRREMFRKYIHDDQQPGLRPYENADVVGDLRRGDAAGQAASFGDEDSSSGSSEALLRSSPAAADDDVDDRPPLPPAASSKYSRSAAASIQQKEFRLVRLRNLYESDLGIFIARGGDASASVAGYFVAYVLPDGLAKR